MEYNELAIVFDTETTGKPKTWGARLQDIDNWPRVSQLAWQVVNIATGELIKEVSYFIKPDGWIIPNYDDFIKKGLDHDTALKESKFFADNNMSTERCETEGLPLEEVLGYFIEDYEKCVVLVAHNMSFDHSVLDAEMIRSKMKASKSISKVCTMERSTDYCKIPSKFNKKAYKWPSLIELHVFLFKVGFSGAHDAGADVTACRVCFLELVRIGEIRPSVWRL